MTNVFISISDLTDKSIRWIDCRFSLQDPDTGRGMYHQLHVNGAIYFDLEKDLSDMSKSEGRHPMPSQEQLKELFEKSGLRLDDVIVLYDAGGEPFAPRGWWMLKYAGFTNVFILKEGFEELKQMGIEMSSSEPKFERTNLNLTFNEDIYASRDFVKDIVSDTVQGVLLDARSHERYLGEKEPIDPIAGRIPTARNFNHELLISKGKFIDGAQVRQELTAIVSENESITVYCGSGVTAAPLFAMLKEIGYPNVKLYVGSYSDWISQDQTIVEKG